MTDVINNKKSSNIHQSERNCNIDLMRIAACVAVVGIHGFPHNLSLSVASAYYICGFAVPFFFMISGFFLLNRGALSLKYSLRKIIGVLRLVLLWNVIVVVIKGAVNFNLYGRSGINLLTLPTQCIKSLIQKGNLWQFWYLGALMFIYALMPFFSRLSRKGKRYLLLVFGTIAIILESVSIISGSSIQINITQTFHIWTWIFYFLLGSEMEGINSIIASNLSVKLHTVITVAVTVINVVYQDYAGTYLIPCGGVRAYNECFYDNALYMIWVIMLFSLVLRLNLRDRVKVMIQKLSLLTMGIYAIHPLVGESISKYIEVTSLTRACIYCILDLFISAMIAWVISNTFAKKYLLKV